MLEGKLLCPNCDISLRRYGDVGNPQILKCNCSQYPLVSGILYLKKDKISKDAVKHLINGQEEKALIKLLNLRLLLFLPLYLLFISKTIAKFSKFFFKKPLYLLLGFENTIRIMTLFSFDKKWAWYLINRKKTPSYCYSLFAAGFIRKKADKVVDVGCGVGHALPEIEKRVNEGNLVGVDSSFLNLFLARKFFVGNRTLLVCADIEKGIPLQDSSVSLIHTNDLFHYLKSKNKFAKESYRVLKTDGLLAILQVLRKPQENILSISSEKLKSTLRLQGYKKINFYSNATLLDFALKGNSCSFLKSDSKESLGDCFSYSCLASKGGINMSFKGVAKKISLKSLDFSQEPWLKDKINLKRILENKNFIFISPHLDDAVFSCAILLKILQEKGKKLHVVSVFTSASDPPYSPQAQEFIKGCGYEDAKRLFEDRKIEDLHAMRFYKADFKHLDFIDAAWRKKNGSHIYKSNKVQFSGKVARADEPLVDKLSNVLENILKIFPLQGSLVLSPLGIGGHADHVIVRTVIEKLGRKILYWEDFPYNTNKNSVERFFNQNKFLRPYFELNPEDFSKKEKAIKMYKSQMKLLFAKDEIPQPPERFYFNDIADPKK